MLQQKFARDGRRPKMEEADFLGLSINCHFIAVTPSITRICDLNDSSVPKHYLIKSKRVNPMRIFNKITVSCANVHFSLTHYVLL
jgi:hypothetical protein